MFAVTNNHSLYKSKAHTIFYIWGEKKKENPTAHHQIKMSHKEGTQFNFSFSGRAFTDFACHYMSPEWIDEQRLCGSFLSILDPSSVIFLFYFFCLLWKASHHHAVSLRITTHRCAQSPPPLPPPNPIGWLHFLQSRSKSALSTLAVNWQSLLLLVCLFFSTFRFFFFF